MSRSLMKPEKGTGVVPAVASGFVPGLGQLINGEGDKALGVFVVAAVAGASVIGVIPVIGTLAGAVFGITWVYGVVDGFFTGRKKGRP
jgi:hypothetical protein